MFVLIDYAALKGEVEQLQLDVAELQTAVVVPGKFAFNHKHKHSN